MPAGTRERGPSSVSGAAKCDPQAEGSKTKPEQRSTDASARHRVQALARNHSGLFDEPQVSGRSLFGFCTRSGTNEPVLLIEDGVALPGDRPIAIVCGALFDHKGFPFLDRELLRQPGLGARLDGRFLGHHRFHRCDLGLEQLDGVSSFIDLDLCVRCLGRHRHGDQVVGHCAGRAERGLVGLGFRHHVDERSGLRRNDLDLDAEIRLHPRFGTGIHQKRPFRVQVAEPDILLEGHTNRGLARRPDRLLPSDPGNCPDCGQRNRNPNRQPEPPEQARWRRRSSPTQRWIHARLGGIPELAGHH